MSRLRGGVDDVAAEGAAVLVGDGAGPAGGLDEEREIAGDGGVFADVGEGGAGADGDGVGVTSMKRSSLRWLMERSLRGEAAGGEGDHELGASGDGGVEAGVVGEDFQRSVEGGGGDEVVLGDV